jgi:hypothetical protein
VQLLVVIFRGVVMMVMMVVLVPRGFRLHAELGSRVDLFGFFS